MALTRVILLVCSLASYSLQQDPVNDFCRRFGHQTAVIGHRLYIDGGLVNYNPISEYPGNYSNTKLLYSDLDRVTGDGMPQLFANVTKDSYVPDVSGGVLWTDDVNKVFYQYGGDFASSPQDFQLWAYDVVYDRWNVTQLTDTSVKRSAWGAGVTVNETGTGYYYGGWLSNSSVPGWTGRPEMTSNLLTYDMVANDWKNNTGPDSKGRAEGAMVFLPASDAGLLIYFGGIVEQGDGSVGASNLSTIFIYDMASSKWYSQTAGGDVPENRRRFCAGAAWPADQSSYNIYLYGGTGIAPNTTNYDDVYVLSLPSFTWTRWWPTDSELGKPHHSTTCNVIGGTQMLVVGGTFPLTEDCDSPNTWGTHNINLSEDGPNRAVWDKFNSSSTEYTVPKAIVAKIGGGPYGGASATAPPTWNNRDLPVYFSRQASFSPRTATREIPKATFSPAGATHGSSNHIGAIVGGAVGGGLGLVFIVTVTACYLCRRRRRGPIDPKHPAPLNSPAELAAGRWSAVEVAAEPKSGSATVSISPTIVSDTYSPPYSTSPNNATYSAPAPAYFGHQYGHYNPPLHLGSLPEHQAPQYLYPSSSPSQYQMSSPTSPYSVLPDPDSPQAFPQPPYFSRPRPYIPHEHALHQQYFPRPMSPPSTTHTPAHFYGQQRANGSRFVEADD